MRRMTTDRDEIKTLSDELLADTDHLEEMERERRQLPPGRPEFGELSVEERHVAEDMTKKAITATELSEQRQAARDT